MDTTTKVRVWCNDCGATLPDASDETLLAHRETCTGPNARHYRREDEAAERAEEATQRWAESERFCPDCGEPAFRCQCGGEDDATSPPR